MYYIIVNQLELPYFFSVSINAFSDRYLYSSIIFLSSVSILRPQTTEFRFLTVGNNQHL